MFPGRRAVVLELPAGGRLRGCVRDAGTGAPAVPFTVLVYEGRNPYREIPASSDALSTLRPQAKYVL